MFESQIKTLFGNDGFIFFKGVVEDNADPRQLGRLRVRVIGDHTQDKSKNTAIPTEELPWAVIINPVTSSSMNGIGTSPTNIVKGTWVFGFYLDSINKQIPAILGTFVGIPSESPDGSIGFHDPDEKFPMPSFLKEPDTNRLARGELKDIRDQYKDCEGKELPESMVPKKGTEEKPYPVLYPMNLEDGTEHAILKYKRTTLNCNNQTYLDVWHEPITQYNAKYPFNTVWEYFFDDNLHGHVEEWDSTPGYERYHRFHSSGTFLEIFNDVQHDDLGRKVEKIVGDNFEIDLKNKHLLVKGDYRVTVEGNRDEYIKGDWLMHLGGCLVWQIDGECTTGKSEGSAVNIDVTGNWDENITGYKDKVIGIRENTKTPLINELTDNTNNFATQMIYNKADVLKNEACEVLELRANMILETTCLLIQNIEDMEMTITPCTTC